MSFAGKKSGKKATLFPYFFPDFSLPGPGPGRRSSPARPGRPLTASWAMRALVLRPPAAAAALAEAVGSLPLRMPASFLLAGGAADAQHERPEPHQPVWLP